MLLFLTQSFAYSSLTEDKKSEVVTTPLISGRCLGLLKLRTQYQKARRKAMALLETTQKLYPDLPEDKTRWKNVVIRSKYDLKKEAIFLEERVYHIEQLIIQRGCPSMTLER